MSTTEELRAAGKPCWTLTYPSGEEVDTGDGTPHFGTQALAQEQAATYQRPDLGTPTPTQLDEPCVTFTCTCCEYTLDEDEDGVLHFPGVDNADQTLPHFGWKRIDGAWRCETCVTGPCDLEADTHG